MPKIEITDEAQKILSENKRESYPLKRLASEAIIEKYGCPKHSMGAASEAAEANPAGRAAHILRAVGTPVAALRHLSSYIPKDGELREKVQSILLDMLETETASKGGK